MEYSLFENEKKMIAQAEQLVAGSVCGVGELKTCLASLANAFRQSYREQQRLIRVSDRQQEQLRLVKEELLVKTELLEHQAIAMQMLNEDLAAEIAFRKQAEEQLRIMANTDVLTGIDNRRRFLEVFEVEIQRVQCTGRPLTYMMVDIDHFKNINDKYGHAVGDEVLRHFVGSLRAGCRAIDVVGRLGGEEFGVVLPETTGENAAGVAERLRSLVANQGINAAGETFHITVSIGVAQFKAGESGHQLIARADAAMYKAKQNGRNRVEVAK